MAIGFRMSICGGSLRNDETDWVKYNAVNEGKKDLPATADALRLWIDHGRDVKDGTYGYVVYAGEGQADLTG